MQITFALVLVSAAYCNVLRGQLDVVSKEPARDGFDKVYDTYFRASDDAINRKRLEVLSRIQKMYLDDLQSKMPPDTVIFPDKFKKDTYLIVKTDNQRNKRYISYLTLCHFKICNMGRKRTTRYIPVIRTQQDNDE